MVFESFYIPQNVIQNPLKMVLVGLGTGIIAFIVGLMLFAEYASVAIVFFTALGLIPFMMKLIEQEEQKDLHICSEVNLFKEYAGLTKGMLALFFGITIGFVFVAMFVPQNSSAFAAQQDTLTSITGRITQPGLFIDILSNNIKVLAVSVGLAFIYGFGAITLLVWNSSVLAVAIRSFFVETWVQTGIGTIFLTFARYFVHGVPEIAAYILAGVAGGVISVACMNHSFGSLYWKKVIGDASQLLVGAIVLLVFAAVLEVYVTPLFF